MPARLVVPGEAGQLGHEHLGSAQQGPGHQTGADQGHLQGLPQAARLGENVRRMPVPGSGMGTRAGRVAVATLRLVDVMLYAQPHTRCAAAGVMTGVEWLLRSGLREARSGCIS